MSQIMTCMAFVHKNFCDGRLFLEQAPLVRMKSVGSKRDYCTAIAYIWRGKLSRMIVLRSQDCCCPLPRVVRDISDCSSVCKQP